MTRGMVRIYIMASSGFVQADNATIVTMSGVKIPRIMTFDILRGWFLVGILIDHLAFFPNGLDWWSARGGLFVTMAEGFFLISGIILGIVRGAKLVDEPFRNVAKLLLTRGWQLYVTSVVLTLFFTLLGLTVYQGAIGLKPDIIAPGTPVWQIIWETITLQYFYGWADYLRLYAVFLLLSPVLMWLLRRGKWYIGLAASLAVWLLFPDSNTTNWMDQEKLQLLSWQLLFYGGMTIGFYWPKLQSGWQSLSQKTRRVTLASIWAVGGMTLLYNVAIMLSTMGYNFSFIGATPQLQHDLYVLFFDKERLPITRIALFMLWFWGWFALVRKFEKPILRVLGWLLIPYGTNSLYVYTVQAFVIFFGQIYFTSGSIAFNFLLSVIFILIPLVMLRYNILGKIIPR